MPQGLDFDEVLEFKVPVHKVYPYDGADGYEVVISELPEGTHKIRFTNSW